MKLRNIPTLILVLLIASCNTKSSSEQDKAAADSAAVSNQNAPYLKSEEKGVAKAGDEDFFTLPYQVDDMLTGSKPFVPSDDDLKKLKVGSKGKYFFTRFKAVATPGIDSRIVGYISHDNNDIRVFWANFDANNAITYVKTLYKDNKKEETYKTTFDTETRILKPVIYESKTGKQYYRLNKKGEFSPLRIPIVYATGSDGTLAGSSLPGATEVTLFNPNCGQDEEKDTSYGTFLLNGSTGNTNSTSDLPTFRPVFAVEGNKVLTFLPKMAKKKYNPTKHDPIYLKLVSGMKDDATATNIETEMEVYEIKHRGNVYEIYMISSWFRYGTYNWFFASVNNDTTQIYWISSVPGTLSCMNPVEVGEDLFLNTYFTWEDSDGNTHEGNHIDYLSPNGCFEAASNMSWDHDSDSDSEH